MQVQDIHILVGFILFVVPPFCASGCAATVCNDTQLSPNFFFVVPPFCTFGCAAPVCNDTQLSPHIWQPGTLQLVLMTGMEQQLADHSPNLAVAITATHLQGIRLPAVDMARLPSIFGRPVGSWSEHKQAIPILQPLRHY